MSEDVFKQMRMTIKQAAKLSAIERYKNLPPAEREAYDNDALIGFIVRCNAPRADVHDAIENRMNHLSPESKAYVMDSLTAIYSKT